MDQSIDLDNVTIGDNNVNISCAILSNTLNASWITEEHVDSLIIDYTCMTSGLEQVIITSNWTMQSQDVNHTVYMY